MAERMNIGEYDVVPFRAERNATVDTFRWARKRLAVTSLIEVDITGVRAAIRAHRSRTGKGLSFTAWVVSCVARAAAEHPRVHAVRQGRRKLVLFREVDVAVLVERAVEGDAARETLPMPYVVRSAQRKSPAEISAELHAAGTSRVQAGAAAIDAAPPAWMQSVFFRLPAWLRDLLLWRWVFGSPARLKRMMGTVVVTATGMTAPGVLAWGVPVSMHPLAVGVGGIAKRSTPSGEGEVLALTVVFDHAIVDGAPVGRFVNTLQQSLRRIDVLDL